MVKYLCVCLSLCSKVNTYDIYTKADDPMVSGYVEIYVVTVLLPSAKNNFDTDFHFFPIRANIFYPYFLYIISVSFLFIHFVL